MDNNWDASSSWTCPMKEPNVLRFGFFSRSLQKDFTLKFSWILQNWTKQYANYFIKLTCNSCFFEKYGIRLCVKKNPIVNSWLPIFFLQYYSYVSDLTWSKSLLFPEWSWQPQRLCCQKDTLFSSGAGAKNFGYLKEAGCVQFHTLLVYTR